MLSMIADALDELKDAFVPTLAKAENDVCFFLFLVFGFFIMN